MSQITTLEKIQNNKKITDNELQIAIRNIYTPALLSVSKMKISYKMKLDNEPNKYGGRPIIYAVNHSCFQDTPIICNAIDEKAYILAGKQALLKEDELFFNLYGSIFLDRKDKEDMASAKIAMEEYLKKGQNLIVFPEATWNLSDELLMLPMKWGIIEIAKNTNAQIIPVVLRYDNETMECHIKYGQTILVNERSSKQQKIEQLRDIMSTIIWLDKVEKSETLIRSEINVESLRKEYRAVTEAYPLLDVDYEESVIFQPETSPDEVFENVKKLELKRENAFLFYKNNIGM